MEKEIGGLTWRVVVWKMDQEAQGVSSRISLTGMLDSVNPENTEQEMVDY